MKSLEEQQWPVVQVVDSVGKKSKHYNAPYESTFWILLWILLNSIFKRSQKNTHLQFSTKSWSWHTKQVNTFLGSEKSKTFQPTSKVLYMAENKLHITHHLLCGILWLHYAVEMSNPKHISNWKTRTKFKNISICRHFWSNLTEVDLFIKKQWGKCSLSVLYVRSLCRHTSENLQLELQKKMRSHHNQFLCAHKCFENICHILSTLQLQYMLLCVFNHIKSN